jgi:hypothetical protein
MFLQRYLVIFLQFTIILFLSSSANAQVFDDDYTQPSPVGIELGIGIQSDRMFRGQDLYNGTSIQPSLRAELRTPTGTFYTDIFVHIPGEQGAAKSSSGAPFPIEDPFVDTTASDESEDTDSSSTNEINVARTTPSFNELDATFGYLIDTNLFVLDFGHISYFYDANAPRLKDTNELFASLAFDVPANPYVEVFYDWDKRKGWYYEFGLREIIPLGLENPEHAVIPFIKFGLNQGLDDGTHPLYEDSGLVFVDFGLYGDFPIDENIRLQPELHYNEGIDDLANSELLFGFTVLGTFGSSQ